MVLTVEVGDSDGYSGAKTTFWTISEREHQVTETIESAM